MRDNKRLYEQACGAAVALDVLGERWALLIVRELLLGPKRFADIRSGLPGVSANVLSMRLDGLEESGVLTKRLLPPPASVSIYELTPWGYQAEPVVRALVEWGAMSPDLSLSNPMSPTTLMLSLRGLLDSTRSRKERATIGFRMGREGFVAKLDAGDLSVERNDPSDADVLLEGTANDIAMVIYGGVALNTIDVHGDRALAKRFSAYFSRLNGH
ncbi:transcriptional regulator [Dyella lipolytica]|uniref:Helix-turn-helix transcriptional regulator n=1 Tax=Dyella lipolytica TaxID=1867835 RepID=A0ABW8IYF3_9GAMM|nr:helix-turn-helix domain-containing protein [Dyella lipolytica]GLQ45722.1 transcriptional regulator [Dyella lipolytica]